MSRCSHASRYFADPLSSQAPLDDWANSRKNLPKLTMGTTATAMTTMDTVTTMDMVAMITGTSHTLTNRVYQTEHLPYIRLSSRQDTLL